MDDAGNAYIAGRTLSGNFLDTTNTFGERGGQDFFVTKLSALGDEVYSAILGGSSIDGFEMATYVHNGLAVSVDAAGSAYLTGMTDRTADPATDFPTTSGAFLETHQGGCGCGSQDREQDAFVTKLSSAGDSLVYSTFLGGTANDHTSDLALDDLGNVYLTGTSFGGGEFPTTDGTFDEDGSGNETEAQSGIVTVLYNDGASLVDSTYLSLERNSIAETRSLWMVRETFTWPAGRIPTISPPLLALLTKSTGVTTTEMSSSAYSAAPRQLPESR